MKINLPQADEFGVRIEDIDVLDIDASALCEFEQLVYEHKLVVFRGQKLDEEQYIEFGRRVGRVEPYFQSNYHHPEHPEIFVSSNVAVDGEKVGVAGTGRFWHVDYQFMSEPLPLTIISPRVCTNVKWLNV